VIAVITNESIKEYLDLMYGNDLYEELINTEQDKVIFNAQELLKDNFKESTITDRAVALQVLYMLESDDLDFGALKNQGIASYSVKGVSVSFKDSESKTGQKDNGLIAPAVMDIMNPNNGAKVGRLI
jgi:hypothetical protein